MTAIAKIMRHTYSPPVDQLNLDAESIETLHALHVQIAAVFADLYDAQPYDPTPGSVCDMRQTLLVLMDVSADLAGTISRIADDLAVTGEHHRLDGIGFDERMATSIMDTVFGIEGRAKAEGWDVRETRRRVRLALEDAPGIAAKGRA